MSTTTVTSFSKPPRPSVRRHGDGYQILPLQPRQGVMSDDLGVIVTNMMPMGLQVLLFFSYLIPIIGLPLNAYYERKYARRFWIENGYNPDTFSSID